MVLVYSITERASFNFVKQVWNIFQVSRGLIMISGLSDIVSTLCRTSGATRRRCLWFCLVTKATWFTYVKYRQKKVTFTETKTFRLKLPTIPGDILAKDFDCNFREVAAADQVNEVISMLVSLSRKFEFS